MTKGQEVKMDLEQRERESKRKLAGDVIKAVTPKVSLKLGKNLGKAGETAGKAVNRYFINDPEWYKKWVKNLDAFTNLPTTRRLGIGDVSYVSSSGSTRCVPGVMAIKYLAHIGLTNGVTGTLGNSERFPINVAIARDYALIRKANGRAVAYSPDVLGFYWLTCVEFAAFLTDLKTVCELADLYSANNAYLPAILIRAKGWNADAVIHHRALLKDMYINLSTRFNSNMVIPSDFTLLKRRVWLQHTILRDMELNRGQFYVFRQEGYGHLDPNDSYIHYSDWRALLNNSIGDVEVFRSTIEGYFSELENSVSFVQVVADIRSAIPEAKFFKLPEYDITKPTFNEIPATHEVLAQIHNIKCAPVTPALTSMTISSTGDYLIQTDLFGTYAAGSQANRDGFVTAYSRYNLSDIHLNAYKDIINGDDILTMTRFVYCGSVTVNTSDVTKFDLRSISFGTELPIGFEIYWDPTDYTKSTVLFTFGEIDYEKVALLTKFDWHPVMYMYQQVALPAYSNCVVGEIGNLFYVSVVNMQEIHRQCILSEYYLGEELFSAAFGK